MSNEEWSIRVSRSMFLAGEDTIDQANRCTNFQNTMTQITIPSEFVKRAATTTKDISALANLEGMKSKTSTVSADEMQRSAVGK